MTDEKMNEIASKMANHTATKEEIEAFLKAYADLTEEIKNELKN